MDNDDYTRTGTSQGSSNFYDNDTASTGDTATLNTLTATLIDSIDGYQKAAADTTNQRFAEMFNARAQERRQAVTQLQAVVAQLGGNPEADGSTTAAIHRGWINLKEAVVGRDDEAIVNEVERGEDYLKAKFEAARNNADLPAEARAAVEEAWTSVRAGHDEMSQLKHAIS
ncbi:ferritin-like domain-containing protein [Tsuneonella sp. HG249]